jgi:hypothetical protein
VKAIREVRTAHRLFEEAKASGHPTLIRLAMLDLRRAYAALAALGAVLLLSSVAQAQEPDVQCTGYGCDDAEYVVEESAIVREFEARPGYQCRGRELEQGNGWVIVCDRMRVQP